MELSNIGLRIKKKMKEKSITIVKLSSESGISRVGINRILGGAVSPTVETLEKIAKALEISINYFFETENSENKAKSKDVIELENKIKELEENLKEMNRFTDFIKNRKEIYSQAISELVECTFMDMGDSPSYEDVLNGTINEKEYREIRIKEFKYLLTNPVISFLSKNSLINYEEDIASIFNEEHEKEMKSIFKKE